MNSNKKKNRQQTSAQLVPIHKATQNNDLQESKKAPHRGIEPRPPRWKRGILTTGPMRNFLKWPFLKLHYPATHVVEKNIRQKTHTQCGARTHDIEIKSLTLYRLS